MESLNIENNPQNAPAQKPAEIHSHRLWSNGLWLPIALFLATCISTFWAAGTEWKPYARLDDFDKAFWAFWQNALQGGLGAAWQQSSAILNLDWASGLT